MQRLWLAILAMLFGLGAQASDRWWPTQAVPKKVARVAPRNSAEHFLAQSLAGLAAKAVNEGRGDELVWMETGRGSLSEWFERWRKTHSMVAVAEPIPTWDLAEQMAKAGIVKGYILFKTDASKGELNDHRAGMDLSANVATSLAGILDGAIVDESAEAEAKARGLKLLLDARGKTQGWCFENYKTQFTRGMLCAQDPKKPHMRDLAIAHKTFALYGNEPVLREALAWMEPGSPVLGWNGGDEFETTLLSSEFGHIQTATDWCLNLTVLMAGSDATIAKRAATPVAKIDWADNRSGISFIDTDGDNVQWLQGNFFHHPSYWGNPARGRIPFGWSSCFSHLEQVCPAAVDFAYETRAANDAFIEWGGGYYYPDKFASKRPDRWRLLGEHARKTWALMQRSGTRIIGFNVAKIDSPDALKSYETFAAQTDGLLGILVFQYSPYEGGAGKTFWVKDRRGVEIPVVSARYSIWENSNRRPRSGTPAKVAREIRRDLETAEGNYPWAIAHVWSYFKRAPGTDEDAENMPQNRGEAENAKRGYDPVLWCAERLPEKVRVITPEEMLWRVRMKRDPEATRRLLEKEK